MSTRLTRRAMLAAVAAAPIAGAASAAGFDWKRFNGSQLRFMVSVHPWTEWAQKQLPALEAETGIKVNLEILYEDQLRQKLPLTLRSDPGAVDAFFTLPSWDGAAFSRARWYAPLEPLIGSELTDARLGLRRFLPEHPQHPPLERAAAGHPDLDRGAGAVLQQGDAAGEGHRAAGDARRADGSGQGD